jgi:hypothetical protein
MERHDVKRGGLGLRLQVTLLGLCAALGGVIGFGTGIGERSAMASAPCNCWGTYTCPADGASYDYDQPRCGAMTKPQASAACNAHCGPACIDSGWFCS